MAEPPGASAAEPPTGELVLAPPPALADAPGALGALVQLLGSVGSVLLVAAMLGSTLGGRWHAVVAAGSGVLAVLGVVAVVGERGRWRARAVTGPRAAYLRYLAGVTDVAREAAARQRSQLVRRHPPPHALPALAEEGSRVWRAGGQLVVRYGVRDQPPSLTLVPAAGDPVRPGDPELAGAVARLVAVHAMQPELPAVVDLRDVERIEVCGESEQARAVARAVMCSAAFAHPPSALRVGVLAPEALLEQWDWVKWLPHARRTATDDAPGPRGLMCRDPTEEAALLPTEGHLLLLVEGDATPPRRAGTTVLSVVGHEDEPADALALRIVLKDGGNTNGLMPARAERPPGPAYAVAADSCSEATAEALARRLARRAGSTGSAPRASADLLHLLGLHDVRRLDASAAWGRRPAQDRLRVPIGCDDEGRPVVIDLKESAEQGIGPHGLVVGATGSGKSELLRTLVVALALTHSPAQLALVLVDFKGGATFAGLSDLPHVSAMLTNLADELALVERMQDVLTGELVRRQELLRSAGVTSARGIDRAGAGDGIGEPLPALLVVVDEFSELLSARPELIDVFVAIGRLGRSLGVHLLLASQRLEEGRLRGLEAHLSYRIGLRTFSAQESQAVLGVRDAFDLPAVPGLGFLRVGAERPVRFQAAFVSAPPAVAAHEDQPGMIPFRAVEMSRPESAAAAADGESLLDLAVARLRGLGPPARRLWLPPLDVPDTLDSLMPDLVATPALGLHSPRWRGLGDLTVPLGVVDRPRVQRRDPLAVSLARSHVLVVGGPRAGTSTALRTLVAALALLTTPVECQVYVLDLGGGFTAYDGLPHVAGIARRTEPDVVRRVVAEVSDVLDGRESYFRGQRIDSMASYRSDRALGRVDDGYGDVVLVVDGWGSLRADFDDLEPRLQQLAARGLGHGIHLVASASRWADVRPATRDLFGTRIELRLGEPSDSEIDRRAAALVPRGRPGRGIVEGPSHVLVALPRIDGRCDSALAGGVDDLVRRVAESWSGPAGPKLRLLPEHLPAAELLRCDSGSLPTGRLLIGLGERRLVPVGLLPDADPHWLVLGDGRSGKTAALRCYLREVVRTEPPNRAQVVLVDPRRSLAEVIPDAYLLHHLCSAERAGSALADLAAYLAGRLPGPDVTAAQLRSRSWWTGAEVYVVVDDHDLVASGHSSPLLPLQPLLAQADDVGLHLVVARRAGGAARALYEPVLQTLRDLAAPVLLLSGSPDEGPLVGPLRATSMPPGRGRLVTRDGVETVQVAWHDPAD